MAFRGVVSVMAKTSRLATGRATVLFDIEQGKRMGIWTCGSRGGHESRVLSHTPIRLHFHIYSLSAQANYQLVARELGLNKNRTARAKAQVDVVPGHGCVTPGGSRRAGDNARMAVTFDDLQPGLQRHIVQRVGELA